MNKPIKISNTQNDSAEIREFEITSKKFSNTKNVVSLDDGGKIIKYENGLQVNIDKNGNTTIRTIEDLESNPYNKYFLGAYDEAKQSIDQINNSDITNINKVYIQNKDFDNFNDTTWEEYHKNIDYTKGTFEKVKLANGDQADYLHEDEYTKPLFEEAEYAIKKAKIIEPEYTETIKEIKSLFKNAKLDLLDNEDKHQFRSKSIQSLANKIFNKNRDVNSDPFHALQSKDFYRDTLLVSADDLTIDNLKLIYQTAEKHGFKPNLEIKTPRGKNAYYGIHFQFTKDGITTELQVSCDDLYRTKNITEKMSKEICSLDTVNLMNKSKIDNNYKESLELYQKVLEGNPSLKSLFASSNDIERVSSSWHNLKYDAVGKGASQEDPFGNVNSANKSKSLQTNIAPLSDGLKNNNSSPSLSLKSDISSSSSNNSISENDRNVNNNNLDIDTIYDKYDNPDLKTAEQQTKAPKEKSETFGERNAKASEELQNDDALKHETPNKIYVKQYDDDGNIILDEKGKCYKKDKAKFLLNVIYTVYITI